MNVRLLLGERRPWGAAARWGWLSPLSGAGASSAAELVAPRHIAEPGPTMSPPTPRTLLLCQMVKPWVLQNRDGYLG